MVHLALGTRPLMSPVRDEVPADEGDGVDRTNNGDDPGHDPHLVNPVGEVRPGQAFELAMQSRWGEGERLAGHPPGCTVAAMAEIVQDVGLAVSANAFEACAPP